MLLWAQMGELGAVSSYEWSKLKTVDFILRTKVGDWDSVFNTTPVTCSLQRKSIVTYILSDKRSMDL